MLPSLATPPLALPAPLLPAALLQHSTLAAASATATTPSHAAGERLSDSGCGRAFHAHLLRFGFGFAAMVHRGNGRWMVCWSVLAAACCLGDFAMYMRGAAANVPPGDASENGWRPWKANSLPHLDISFPSAARRWRYCCAGVTLRLAGGNAMRVGHLLVLALCLSRYLSISSVFSSLRLRGLVLPRLARLPFWVCTVLWVRSRVVLRSRLLPFRFVRIRIHGGAFFNAFAFCCASRHLFGCLDLSMPTFANVQLPTGSLRLVAFSAFAPALCCYGSYAAPLALLVPPCPQHFPATLRAGSTSPAVHCLAYCAASSLLPPRIVCILVPFAGLNAGSCSLLRLWFWRVLAAAKHVPGRGAWFLCAVCSWFPQPHGVSRT